MTKVNDAVTAVVDPVIFFHGFSWLSLLVTI